MKQTNLGDLSPVGGTNSNFFIYAVLVFTIVVMGILIANVVYFRSIRNDDASTAVSKTQANNMFVLNSIMLAIVVCVFLYSSITILLGSRRINEYKQVVTDKNYIDRFSSWGNSTPSGFNPRWPINQNYQPGMPPMNAQPGIPPSIPTQPVAF
jgi:hypothetical protein